MNLLIAQQVALDDALVKPEDRVTIGKCNMRIDPTKTQKEATYQVVLDTLAVSPCYNAFLITADVPEIYMHQFWFTISKIMDSLSYQFKPDNKNEEIVTFIKEIGYKGDLESITELFTDHMYQPWRTFASVINICLSGKTTDIMFQIDNRQTSAARRTNMPYPRFTKEIIQHFISKDKSIFMRNRLFMHSIKHDSVLGQLKFVAKNEHSQVYGKMIPDVMKGTKAANVSKKKDSFTADDNIITDDPNVALELGKSIKSSMKLKGIELLYDVAQLEIDTQKAVKARKRESRSQFESRGSSEGAGFKPEVPDESKDKSADSSEGAGTSPEVPNESKGKTASDDEDDWGTGSDNDDVEITDATKTNADKAEEEENVEKAEEEKKEDELKGDDQAKYEQEVGSVSVTHKDKPDLLLSNSNHSVSSTFGNQFLNISPNVSLIGTIYENTDAEITSLMDIEILHVVPNIQQDPLHEIPVSVISTPTTLPTTPPPITSPPATTTRAPLPPSFEPETLTAALQRLSVLEQEVQELKHFNQSDFIYEAIKTQVPAAVNKYLGSTLGDTLQKALQKHTEELRQELSQKDVSKTVEINQQEPQKSATEIRKIKMEQATKQQLPKHSVKPFDQDARAGFNQKEILFQMMRENKRREDMMIKIKTLMLNQTKGTTQSQPQSTGKSVQAEETVFKAAYTNMPLNQGDDTGNTDEQPNVEAVTKDDFFKKPIRPPTPDPEWNTRKSVDDALEQNFFFNNDLEYLRRGSTDIKYSTSTTKTKAAKYEIKGIEDMVPKLWSPIKVTYDKVSRHDVYSTMRILSVTSVTVDKWYGYGHLKEIVVRRADQKLYKIMEGDFPRLHLNDIEDMLLLIRVEDLQLGVKSYQKKLNITKPQTRDADIYFKELYTTHSKPQGVIYEDKLKRKRLMRNDELYKFIDGTLDLVHKTLQQSYKVRIMQKITSKRSKPDKHGHRNGKSAQEQGIIKLWSTKVNPGQKVFEQEVEDEILREKLLNVNLLIDKIEALKLTPFVLENPSSSPILVVDSDFLIEEVDTYLVPEDSIPPGIKSDFDSKGNIVFLDNLLNEDPILEYERFTFDIEPDAPVINNFDELNEDECFDPGKCGVNLLLGTYLNCTYGDGKPVTCCGCEGPLKGGFCSFCASRDGNSFDYNPNPNSFNESQNFSDYPPQPQYETNICKLCGNDAHYDYDCSPQVPFVYNQNPCFDQNFDNNFPPTSPSFPQQYLCCENCGGPHATFQCQPMNQNLSNSNSSGFDQFQPPQYPVIHHSPQETSEEVLQAREDLMKAIQTFLRKFSHVRNINEELSEFINSPSWNRPTFYNDDDEYTIIYRKPKVITPDLPIEEPDNALSMGDEHLNTCRKQKREVKWRTLSQSQFCGLINSLLSRDSSITSPKIDFLPEEFTGELDFINPILPGIDEEEGEIDNDILQIEDEILREKLLNVNLLVDKIEALELNPFIPFVLENPSSSPIPVMDSDFLVEEVDTFIVPKDSIPPGIESDLDSEGDIVFLDNLLNDDPIPEYERFTFDIEPDAPVIKNFVELNEDEYFDPGGGEIDVFTNVEVDDYFPFIFFIRFFCYTPKISEYNGNRGGVTS
ncbi:hypothetical protein Tco_1387146 [Tanacetum coccineum]